MARNSDKELGMKWALSDKGSIGVDDLLSLGRPFIGTIRVAEEAEVFGGVHGLVIYFNECKKPFVPCLNFAKVVLLSPAF